MTHSHPAALGEGEVDQIHIPDFKIQYINYRRC